MSTQSRPERRIPKMSADDSAPLYRGYTVNDSLLVIIPTFIAMVVLIFAPPIFYLPGIGVSAIGSLLGVIAVITAPEYYTSWEWVSHHLNAFIRPTEYHHIQLHADHDHRQQQLEPEAHIVTKALVANQRTQDLIGVKRVYPSDDVGAGAIELTDTNKMVAAIQVSPANLTLATPRQWRNATSGLATAMNTIDFETHIYITNRSFDTEQFLEPYKNRRTDDDILDEPALEELLGAFLSWYPDRLESFGTTISESYMLVAVSPEEVKSESRSTGLKDSLAEKPILSAFIDVDNKEIPEAVVRGRQRERLYDRVSQLKSAIRGINDVDSQELPAEDHAELIAWSWERKETDLDMSEQFSNLSVVHHQQEAQRNEA